MAKHNARPTAVVKLGKKTIPFELGILLLIRVTRRSHGECARLLDKNMSGGELKKYVSGHYTPAPVVVQKLADELHKEFAIA